MSNVVFTPYRVCPLRAHVDHQHGYVTGFAIDKGVKLEFDVTNNGEIELRSKNYDGITQFNLHDELEREMTWGFCKGGSFNTIKEVYTD